MKQQLLTVWRDWANEATPPQCGYVGGLLKLTGCVVAVRGARGRSA